MSYCTSYSLNFEGDRRGEYEKIMTALCEKGILGYALNDNLEPYDKVKWYKHMEDMTEISKMFPSILFILDGIGEDNFDVWRAFFKNGDSEKVNFQIIEPERPKRFS